MNVQNSWSAIEALTAAMRAAAETEDWVQVMELAATRHENLERHFELFPVGPANADFYQRHLTAMLSNESELHDLAFTARREVMRSSVAMHHNKRAVTAYLQ
jgi:hypothetical protein